MRQFKPHRRPTTAERAPLEKPPTGLILSRGIGEAIIIGKDILITVVEIRGSSRVKLCVTAPPDVEVDRTEVRESKDASRNV